MILEIDAGNTLLKWRVVTDQGKVLLRGRQDKNQNYEDISEQLSGLDIEAARISCVSGVQMKTDINDWLSKFGSIQISFARTLKSFSGLEVVYENPERLGVDRWLVMLAAWSKGEACCVIDCGSAITVDLVNIDGKHLGGYIVPGLKTMHAGLLGETQQIKMDPGSASCSLDPGVNTNEAVNNGILRMAVGFVQSVLDEIGRDDKDWKIVMTGGDMETIKYYLSTDFSIESNPELVLDGLSVALR